MNHQRTQHPYLVDLADYPNGCTCGGEHLSPRVTLYSGEDACRVLAEDCGALYAHKSVLLISDPQTDRVIGKSLREELANCQVELEHYALESNPSATDHLVEKIQAVSQHNSLIISVGSGTINDLGKFAAARNGIDFWSMPTAPSMNGYTSGIAAIKVNGVKCTLPATPPQRIYATPQVIRQAPLKLRQAGFCDVLAKVVSDIDWQCESLLQSRSYCGLPSAMMKSIEQTYAAYPEAIGQGEEKAIRGLFEGLLLSGVAMSLAGSSAPASGGEHLVSHFWDMREPLTGRKPELHGLQVGLGIILSTACYARLAQCQAAEISNDATRVFTQTAENIPEIWGYLSEEVALQFEGKREILQQFERLLPQYWSQLLPLFQQVPPPAYFRELFTRTGAPFTLDAFGLSQDEFRLAALNARAIRSRVTVLDIAAHMDVLEAATEDALRLLI